MKSTFTIEKRLTLTCTTLLALSALQAFLATTSFLSVKSGVYALATDSIPGIVAIDQTAIDIRDLRAGMLQHIASSRPEEIRRIEEGLAHTNEKLNADLQNYNTSITNDEDRRNYEQIRPLVDSLNTRWLKVRDISRNSTENAQAYALFTTDVFPVVNSLFEHTNQMLDWNKRTGNATLDTTRRVSERGL